MRFKNEDADLKIYAVTGTQTVLLSLDIAKSKVENKKFLGFDVQRKDSKGKIKPLNGSKHFASLQANNNLTDKQKNLSLVQTFYWQDYTADPGEAYTYTFSPMFGTALNHAPKFVNSIKVKTEELQKGKHSVYFNFGVTGSQAYARNKEFGNKPVNDLKGDALKHALEFLGRELWSDGLLKFVKQAKNSKFSLYCSFYEFQHLPFLQEIKAAVDRNVDVQIVVSGKEDQYEDKTYKNGTVRLNNKSMIAKAGLTKICKPLRTKPSQPHNKFMILCENGVATQVWTGSTNITLAGIFGQCNTGHWVVDKDIAAKYLKYWKGLRGDDAAGIPGDPSMGVQATLSETIQPDTDLTKLTNGTYVFFSPRDRPVVTGVKPVHLENYAKLINSAKEMVCMIFPFNYDEVFAKVYNNDKDYLRLLIFESSTEAGKAKSNDRDVKITGGAIYTGKEKEWAKEITSKATTGAGILYVHNKFFIIDALSDDPIVLTGSANFSGNSIQNNDENSMLIKGDKRVADIYLSEFDRLFVHFLPRYLSGLPGNKKNPFAKSLDETFTWHQDHYDDEKYQGRRKVMFKKMKGAVKG